MNKIKLQQQTANNGISYFSLLLVVSLVVFVTMTLNLDKGLVNLYAFGQSTSPSSPDNTE
jgi:hypothetical protein